MDNFVVGMVCYAIAQRTNQKVENQIVKEKCDALYADGRKEMGKGMEWKTEKNWRDTERSILK